MTHGQYGSTSTAFRRPREVTVSFGVEDSAVIDLISRSVPSPMQLPQEILLDRIKTFEIIGAGAVYMYLCRDHVCRFEKEREREKERKRKREREQGKERSREQERERERAGKRERERESRK